MQNLDFFIIHFKNEFAVALGIFMLFFVLAVIVRFLIRNVIANMAKKTKTEIDDKLILLFRRPVFLGVILFGAYLSFSSLSILNIYQHIIDVLFSLIAILWTSFITTAAVNILFAWLIEKLEEKRQRGLFYTVKKIINAVIYAIALLLVFQALGFKITPILASLGIGGLAVALALKDTLSNFFGGLYISAGGLVKLNDYIELSDGKRGYVEKIGWRNTQIRQWDNNLLIIPNGKLSETTLLNYNEPSDEISVVIDCGVSYESDLDKVEKIAVKTGKEVLKKLEGAIEKEDPILRFREFGDNNINFKVIMKVATFKARYNLIHDYIKSLKKAFDKEKITINYPTRRIVK